MSDKTKFTVLKVNDFTAERRAMSIVVKNQNTGKIYAFVKGAETASYSMLGEGKNAASLAIEIEKFSNRGLRTLVFAYKEISEMNEEFESGLILLGATAVEDLLQEDVASNISEFQQAGIKTWMVTGDNGTCAKEIGFSCGILNREVEVLEITDH
jgi:phospholipid-translocating ATPase